MKTVQTNFMNEQEAIKMLFKQLFLISIQLDKWEHDNEIIVAIDELMETILDHTKRFES